MTTTEAWTLVLEHYHDDFGPELQWKPGIKCPGSEMTTCSASAP